ncbi:MAG: ABC transporter ATP-binding protein [Desulfobacter sp.]
MLKFVKRMIDFSGPYRGRLYLAFFYSFLESVFIQAPILVLLYALLKISAQILVAADVLFMVAALLASVVCRMFFRRLLEALETTTGYRMFADERMRMGDRLKQMPMGYFSEGAIGDVTAVITSDITFIEQYGMIVLARTVSATISITITALMLAIFDYRIGIIAAVAALAAFSVMAHLRRNGRELSPQRQQVQSDLVGSVLEFVNGMHVIKAFNLTGEKGVAARKGFKHFRDIMITFEKRFIPPFFLLDTCIAAGTAGVICMAAFFSVNQSMDAAFALVLVIFAFEVFVPIKIVAGGIAQTKVAEAGLDRYQAIMSAPVIDEGAGERKPERFDIEFNQVEFAYDTTPVIRDMSFRISEKSMTALVGPSGSGKSTVASLIARFWDPQSGEIRIGGVNIREMTCDALLAHISMVFQKVYLFNDTILNNIRFGRPGATMDEVVAVCKKARCHAFISDLEEGYHTVVGEGGCTLSGGERQRISIARAMLKDAPIVLLDEATASVDPDNERHIQEAISELVKDKTLVVIAHRLSTIKTADHILVINKGGILESGKHEDLMALKGLYHGLWTRRVRARSWQMSRIDSDERSKFCKSG